MLHPRLAISCSLLAGAVFALLPGVAHAAARLAPAAHGQYWVSAARGHDADGAGRSPAYPFRSLGYAMAHVPAHATVHVAAGRYAPFAITRSGVSVLGDSPAGVIVRGRAGVPGVVELRAAHTRVANLTITHCVPRSHPYGDFEAAGSASVRVRHAAVGAVVSGLRIRNGHGINSDGQPFGCFGVWLGRARGVTVAGNDIAGQGEGVFLFRGGQGVRVIDNRIHDNRVEVRNTLIGGDDFGGSGVGLFLTHGRPGPSISGNTIYRNIAASHDYGTDGGAFDVFQASDARITRNHIFDNENVLETGAGPSRMPCANNLFADNLVEGRTAASHLVPKAMGLILRCATGMRIVGNTFRHIDWWVFDIEQRGIWAGALHNLTIAHNTVTQGWDATYVVLVHPQQVGMRFTHNRFHYLGTLGIDWAQRSFDSLPAWRRATDLDAGSLRIH